MHIQVELHTEVGTTRSLSWDKRRIAIAEMIDQWYGRDYRYVKVKGDDGSMYILRFDEIRNEWELIMFASRRSQALVTQAA
jgi:hypothetical protein